ncbi:MAG: DUF2089 domain-containing protein [Chloroflexota bacterium]
MNQMPTRCPLCGGELASTRIYCRDCDTTLEGRFTSGVFSELTPEQLNFIVTFVRCEGKISRMEEEIGLSYPTIRNRLQEVIRALGYEPGGSEEPAARSSEQDRQRILEDLDAGRIRADEAMRLLKEMEA